MMRHYFHSDLSKKCSLWDINKPWQAADYEMSRARCDMYISRFVIWQKFKSQTWFGAKMPNIALMQQIHCKNISVTHHCNKEVCVCVWDGKCMHTSSEGATTPHELLRPWSACRSQTSWSPALTGICLSPSWSRYSTLTGCSHFFSPNSQSVCGLFWESGTCLWGL